MAKVFFTLQGKKISLENLDLDVNEDFKTDEDIDTRYDCGWYVLINNVWEEINENTYYELRKIYIK